MGPSMWAGWNSLTLGNGLTEAWTCFADSIKEKQQRAPGWGRAAKGR